MTSWPHAPPHRLTEAGAYLVTCGTYQKRHILNTPNKLGLVQNMLLDYALEFGWELHAWAVLSNHYHFLASSPEKPETLRRMISKLHTMSARDLNVQDGQVGRKVWFQYFETHITFPNSYYPRLKYVHHNPTHHGVVRQSEQYTWCSAAWFAQTARRAFFKTVMGFKTDTVQIEDDFEPLSTDLVGEGA